MKIGYNKLICSLPILLALLLGALTIYANSKVLPTSNGGIFITIGLLVLSLPMLFVSYIVVTDTEIKINNEFGMTRRRASISSLKNLKFVKGNLLVKKEDEFVKIYFNKVLVDPKGIKALKTMVDAAK